MLDTLLPHHSPHYASNGTPLSLRYNLSYSIGSNLLDELSLQKKNPLAYRILLRIKVKCPLGIGCKWQGEFSELIHHLSYHKNNQEKICKKIKTKHNTNDYDEKSRVGEYMKK